MSAHDVVSVQSPLAKSPSALVEFGSALIAAGFALWRLRVTLPGPQRAFIGALDPRTPIPLFVTSIGGVTQGIYRQQYRVSADGRRFLMNTVREEPSTVVLNWKPEQ